jgi:nitrate/nitrite transport system substrate-binding protein
MSKISRRNFLFTASATTAATLIINGCSSSRSTSDSSTTGSSPAPSPVAAADAPEVTTAKLGFIALTDAAPLIIAKEKGMFAKYGMPDVEVSKQASWAVTRDNLELGSGSGGIDGAHILTPMPYLMTAGTITKGGAKVPMNILARLNVNGQGISLSNAYSDLKVSTDSSPLKEAFAKGKAEGREMKCAVTFPGGTHDLWMRYWLAAGATAANGGQH